MKVSLESLLKSICDRPSYSIKINYGISLIKDFSLNFSRNVFHASNSDKLKS